THPVLAASSAAHCNTQPGRQQRHESTFTREVGAHRRAGRHGGEGPGCSCCMAL
ncbi:unnamed protein product, partial [Closterium sp. Naga37s-1]